MKEYLYLATFDTKKGGNRSWCINITASNKKEARKILGNQWPAFWCPNRYILGENAHMFHIAIRRVKVNEGEEPYAEKLRRITQKEKWAMDSGVIFSPEIFDKKVYEREFDERCHARIY